jgi:predicted nucleotidyltransferase
MRPSEALAKNREATLAIIGRYQVSNPRIFGSTARGEDSEGSDLDILVDHDGRISTFDLARLEIELERLLRTRVDVKTSADLSASVARRVARDLRPL